jgi:hypothetical protein
MRGIQIQRPIIVTEKQKMYGDVFHTTQDHQHVYECVQPLQGLITFGEPKDDDMHRNNLSWMQTQPERPTPKRPHFLDWDYAIYAMLVVKFSFGVAMLWDVDRQTTYNDMYLTNFMPSPGYSTYSVEGAGMTNPLYCLLIALSLVIFSVIIGLTSSKKYMFNLGAAFWVFALLVILQCMALGLHITMLVKLKPDSNYYCLTTLSMIILHALTFILSLIGLVALAMTPISKQAKKAETKEEFDKRVTQTENGYKIEPVTRKNQAGEIIYDSTEDDKADYERYKQKNLTYEDIQRETTSNFWLSVVEDYAVGQRTNRQRRKAKVLPP